ncbi:MAG: M20/M25/M40 family metallo-hydrolase [Aggregatilineales bacterium]
MDFSAFDAYVDAHVDQAIADLCDLCAIPSTANNPPALQQAVVHVVRLAERAGLRTELVTERADRPPIVLGEAGAGKPILMVYNHYDVQPADPLDEWHTPPFTPTLRNGHLYARGVADNKVNLVARLSATEAYRAVFGELPVHVRFVWEGEEESGGDQLRAFTQARAAWIAEADGCLWESGYRDDSGAHVLSLGVKGLLCVELAVRTGIVDAHSGQAALVPNAAWRLIEALATLRAPDGSLMIDGFAEQVAPIEGADRALLAALPFNETDYRARYGIARLVGDRHGIDAQEALFFRPTCTINGLVAGYTGEGSKTIVPCQARATLDMRLVPDLTPPIAFELLQAHLARRGFTDVTVTEIDSGTMPARTSPTTAIARAAIEALRNVSGRAPIVYPLNPASGPMYELCQAHGVPAANFGCGWSGSRVHAPNENIRISDFIEGIKAFGRLLAVFPRCCRASD